MSKEPGIILSDQHGVNPTLLKCEWCGKDTGTIALVGKQHYYICKTCSFKHIGRPKYGHCVKCAAQGINSKVYKGNEFDGSIDHVRMGLCDECDAKREEQAAIVRAGGIYFRCLKCGSEGVVKASSPLCSKVRKNLGVEPPDPCGVEFDDCPHCNPDFYGGDGGDSEDQSQD